MKLLKNNPLSLASIWLGFLVVLALRLTTEQWEAGGGSVISWDTLGYYLYLPAWFIYHDITIMDWAPGLIEQYNLSDTFYQASHLPDQEGMVMKYSMGMAILYLPFFFIAHLLAEPLGYAADGFSAPYQAAVGIGSTVYVFIGLLFTRKVLLRYFNDKVAAIVLVLLVLGTNYLQFSAYKTLMPHMPGFMITAMVLWFTIKWHDKPNWKTALILGLSIGFAALIRPTEGFILVIPLLWGVKNWSTLKEKFALLWKYRIHLGLVALGVFLGVLPQLIYWKYASGAWIFYSYGGEGFFWTRPQLSKVLFEFRKGWYIYTPIMFLATLGLGVVWRKQREIFLPLLIFLCSTIYFIACWSIWWFAASFGHRAFVQSYAMMAIPLGFLIAAVLASKKGWLKGIFFPIVILLMALNLFQHWQFHHGLIDPVRMTQEYYWHVFLKTDHEGLDRSLLGVREFYDPSQEYIEDPSQFAIREFGVLDYEHPFEDFDSTNANRCTNRFARDGQYSFQMDSTIEYGPGFRLEVRELNPIKNSWVRLSVDWYTEDPIDASKGILVFDFSAIGMGVKYKALDFDVLPHVPGQWNTAYLDAIIPESRYSDDILNAYVWHPNRGTIYLDNLRLEVFDPIKANHLWTFAALEQMNGVQDSTYWIDVIAPDTFISHLSPAYPISPPVVYNAGDMQDQFGPSAKFFFAAKIKPLGRLEPNRTFLVMEVEKRGEPLARYEQAIPWRRESGQWTVETMMADIPYPLPHMANIRAYVVSENRDEVLVDDLQLNFKTLQVED